MSDKKRELTDEELKAAAGGSDRVEERRESNVAPAEGADQPYRCDDDPSTDDC